MAGSRPPTGDTTEPLLTAAINERSCLIVFTQSDSANHVEPDVQKCCRVPEPGMPLNCGFRGSSGFGETDIVSIKERDEVQPHHQRENSSPHLAQGAVAEFAERRSGMSHNSLRNERDGTFSLDKGWIRTWLS